jgi:hypothetical protein
MVVANERHGPRTGHTRVVTHLGCGLVAAVVTIGVLSLIGVGTLLAVLSVTEYLSMTLLVWLVLFWWVLWWLTAESLVNWIRDGRLV